MIMRKIYVSMSLILAMFILNVHASGLPESTPPKDYCDTCIVRMEYFFNHDPGFGNGISIPLTPAENIENLTLDLDMSSLDQGFNHFYVRAKDSQNNWSLSNTKSFYKETIHPEIPDVTSVEYFMDTDPGQGLGTHIPFTAANTISNLNFVADISEMESGFHHIYFRAKDSLGSWSLTNTKSFYKETVLLGIPGITSVEYFMDNDPGEGLGTQIPFTAVNTISELNFVADISEIGKGFHHIYVRAKDSNGRWSFSNTLSFYKEILSSDFPELTYLEYFLDDDPGEGLAMEIPISPATNIGEINIHIDISETANGFHKLYVRAKDANGNWSFNNVKSFFKETLILETPDIAKVEYFVDNDPGYGNGMILDISPSHNIQNMDFLIDISGLPIGEHNIYVRAMDQNEHWSLTNIKTVIIDPHPKITIAPDFWMDCEDYDFEQKLWLPIALSAAVQDANSLVWTSAGDGTFEDPASLSPFYFPGENDIINGQIEITLTATGFEDNLTVNKHTTLHIPTQLIHVTESGWRGISSYIDNEDFLVSEVLIPVENHLTIFKDAEGNTYNPTAGINNIGNWDAVGYMANFTNAPTCLPLYGNYISNKVFEIIDQVTYLPVLTDTNIAIEDLFRGHLDQIQTIYDWSTFQSWTPDNPEFTHLKPGFAYLLSTLSDTKPFTIEFSPFTWEDPLTFITLQGKITDENGDPVENAEVTISENSSVSTNHLGQYNATVPLNWSGEITISKAEWTFYPESRALENVVVNIYDMDFEGLDHSCDPGWTYTQTPFFHTLSIPLDASPALFDESLTPGDWVGVFYLNENDEKQCGGAAVWTGTSNIQITAFGNDPTSPEKTGFYEGEQVQWKIYSCVQKQDFPAFATYNPLMPQTSGNFENYGFSSLLSLEGWMFQEIILSKNWNDLSLWLNPQNPYVEDIFAPMVNNLVIMKNLNSLYWPGNSINTIGWWDINSGYVLKMHQESILEIYGSPNSNSDLSFSIDENSWFYLPVLSQCPVYTNALLYDDLENIVMVKDLLGQKVWWPEAGIHSLEELLPGEAYEIKIKNDLDLTFPHCENKKSVRIKSNEKTINTIWGSHSFSPFTHTIAFPEHLTKEFPSGIQIGVFGKNGNLYGAFQYSGESSFAILVNGDDPNTIDIDGMIEGEDFEFYIFDPARGIEYPVELEFDEQMPQGGYFMSHGLSAVKSLQTTGLVNDDWNGVSVSVYPNPSSDIFNIRLTDQTSLNWEVTNSQGSVIALGNDETNDFNIDISKQPKGIYYLKITQGQMQSMKKLVLQ